MASTESEEDDEQEEQQQPESALELPSKPLRLIDMPGAILDALQRIEPHDTEDAQMDILVRWFRAWIRQMPSLSDALAKLIELHLLDLLENQCCQERGDVAALLVRITMEFLSDQATLALLLTHPVLATIKKSAVCASMPILRTSALQALHTVAMQTAGLEWIMTDAVLLQIVVSEAIETSSKHVITASIEFLIAMMAQRPLIVNKILDSNDAICAFKTLKAWESVPTRTNLFCLDLCSAVLASQLSPSLKQQFFVINDWNKACILRLQARDRHVRTKATEVFARLIEHLPDAATDISSLDSEWNSVESSSVWCENLFMPLLLSSDLDTIQSGLNILRILLLNKAERHTEIEKVAAVLIAFARILCHPTNKSSSNEPHELALASHIQRLFSNNIRQADRLQRLLLAAALEAIPTTSNLANPELFAPCLCDILDQAKGAKKLLKTLLLGIQRLASLAEHAKEIGNRLLLMVGDATTDTETTMLLLQTLLALLKHGDFAKTYLSNEEWCQRLGHQLNIRFMDVRWEVRDTALELVTIVAAHKDTCGVTVRKVLQRLVHESEEDALLSCIHDSEPYVRASALVALGTIAQIKTVTLPDDCLLKMFQQVHDSEAIVRRAAVDLLATFAPTFPKMLDDQVMKGILNDADWEVKMCGLRLLCHAFKQNEPMIEWFLSVDGPTLLSSLLSDANEPVRTETAQVLRQLMALANPQLKARLSLIALPDDYDRNEETEKDVNDDEDDLLKWTLQDLFAHQHFCDQILDCY